MTATLIAAVVIGQIGITVNQPLKAFAFLMFLFAVGYGVHLVNAAVVILI